MRGVLMGIEYSKEKIPNQYGREEEVPVVYLWARGEDGKRYKMFDTSFRPYFYVYSGVPLNFGGITHIDEIQAQGQLFKKVTVKMPDDVRRIRSILEGKSKGYAGYIYEADILFIYRYLIDKKIRSSIEWTSNTDFHPINDKMVIEPRIVALDLEIYSKGARAPGKIRPSEYICAITLHDSYTDRYFTYYKRDIPLTINTEANWAIYWCQEEIDLLRKVFSKLKELDPDIITGYNVDFDLMHLRYQAMRKGILGEMEDISPIKYIPRPRMQKKKLRDILVSTPRIKIPGRSVCDILEVLLAIHKAQLVEYNLDFVARKFLNPPDNCKVTMPDGTPVAEHMIDAWDNNPELVLRYNKRDVELCVRLNKERRLFSFMDQLRKLVGAKVEDALSAKKLIDLELLRRSSYPLPNARKRSSEYKGAVVVAPVLKRYGWTIQLDYRQMYATIMLTYNIDPDTWLYKDWIVSQNLKPEDYYAITDPETGEIFYFKKYPLGTMPQMIKDFLVARDEKRKLMKEAKEKGDMKMYDLYDAESFALKSFINAVYGVLSYRFRLSSKYCGKTITLCGRELTKLAIKTATDLGYNVIYGDTDSIFVEAKAQGYYDCVREGLMLKRKVEEGIPYLLALNGNTEPTMFSIEVDKIYSAFFTLDVKKRYAGYIEDGKNPKRLYTAGLETKRSDSSRFAKILQEQVIRMLLDGATKEDVFNYVTNTLNTYDSLDPLEIAVPSALTKDPKDYKVNSIQKRAALLSNEYLKTTYREGDKPKRLYVKEVAEKKPEDVVKPVDVIAITRTDQIPDWLVIDYPKMITQTIKKKIEKMLLVQGIAWEDLGLKEILKPKKKERKKKQPKSQAKSQTTMDVFTGGKENVQSVSETVGEGKQDNIIS